MSEMTHPLRGLRVLVVEDETLVAMLIEEYLLEFGCEIAFSANRVAKAAEALETRPIDAAILDFNVAGENISDLAEALTRRGIPFILASGYGARDMNGPRPDAPVLQKPFTEAELRDALVSSLQNRK